MDNYAGLPRFVFATKLWNITNFVMLFQAVMNFLSRLVEFKILVNWGMVHWCRVLIFFINSIGSEGRKKESSKRK